MRSSVKRRVEKPSRIEEKLDRISDLPRELIGKILSHLPIRDAVRTGIFSRKWRYKWMMDLSRLEFDSRCIPSPSKARLVNCRLVKVIDSVLVQHSGWIQKFTLWHMNFQANGDIDKWILHLSRASISELILGFSKDQLYQMPSYLFMCQDLVILTLKNCSLRIPPMFLGFKNLESLDLCEVLLPVDSLEKLISSCPRLTTLKLKLLHNITHLNIDAPNLKDVDLQGGLRDVSFNGNTNLSRLRVCFTANIEYRQSQAEKFESNMCKFFVDLLNVQRLTIESYTLRYLSAGTVPAMLPVPLFGLRDISLCVNLCTRISILSALCILRSCPSVTHVQFRNEVDDEDELEYEGRIIKCDTIYRLPCDLKSLKFVSVEDLEGSSMEMGFLEFLLSSAPRLERMVVRASSCVPAAGSNKLLKELVQFPRASVRAKIVYLEHNDPRI